MSEASREFMRRAALYQRHKRGPKGYTLDEALAIHNAVAAVMRARDITEHAAAKALAAEKNVEILPGVRIALSASRWRRIYSDVRKYLAMADRINAMRADH